MHMNVRVFVYFEQDKVQKEMGSTSVKYVIEVYPFAYMIQYTCRDVTNVMCDFIQYSPQYEIQNHSFQIYRNTENPYFTS